MSNPVDPINAVKPDKKSSQWELVQLHKARMDQDAAEQIDPSIELYKNLPKRQKFEKPLAHTAHGGRIQQQLLEANKNNTNINSNPTDDSEVGSESSAQTGTAAHEQQVSVGDKRKSDAADDSPLLGTPAKAPRTFASRRNPAIHNDDQDLTEAENLHVLEARNHRVEGAGPIDGAQRAEGLAMVTSSVITVVAHTELNKQGAELKVKPKSRVECQRRCGRDGFCDPSSEFGCGGEFCKNKVEVI